MFSGAARRYDLLNRILSLGQDSRWRCRLAAAVAQAPDGAVLDLATGTGDVALRLAPRQVIGADFCVDMLVRARDKARRSGVGVAWLAADGLQLPFRSSSFAAVTVAFGVRNFASLKTGLDEMVRILSPGGLLGVLEFQLPPARWQAVLHRCWARCVVTPVGWWLSDNGSAYRYLPASMAAFPNRRGLAGAMETAGLRVISGCQFSLGIVGLTVARRES